MKIATGSACAFTSEPDSLGESPFWHDDERALYWIDIAGQRINRKLEDGTTQSWLVHSQPGCIAPRAGGGLAIALRDGVYVADEWGSQLRRVATLPYDRHTTRANDGKAGPDGRLWIGTIYEPRDRPLASLYSIDFHAGSEPQVNVKANTATVGNGLAWSPDGRTLYWSDTSRHVVQAWDWDAQANSMDNRRVFHEFAPKPQNWRAGQPGYGGRPDGAAVDSQGNYWCAMYEGARLVKLSPAGELLREIALPVMCPTMPCFGGEDLKTIFVTSARANRSVQELEEFPLSGRVIGIRVDVPGRPVDRVAV